MRPALFGPRFTLGEAERAKIEAAYGHELSEKLWQSIIPITDRLTVNQPSVNTAARLDRVLRKLDNLAIAATSLQQEIIPKSADAADLDLQDIWRVYFHPTRSRKTPPRNGEFFEFLLELLGPIIAIGAFTKKCVTQKADDVLPRGPDGSFYWEVWILSLTRLFELNGLPCAARKDSDKKQTDKHSEFVLFIAEMQKYLPKECRKFTHSYDALAQGIHRARDSYRSEMELKAKKRLEAALRQLESLEEEDRCELARRADAVKWRLRDARSLLSANYHGKSAKAEKRAEEKLELYLSSNEAVDLIRKGKLDAAERAARDLLTRFPQAYDGYDRLGMVHEARGENRQAAECYRKVIEVVRRHPDKSTSGLKDMFSKLADRLDATGRTA